MVVNPKTTWVDYLTVAELKKIWESGSQVNTWKDFRENWPDRKIRLYGPGTDSGTFDYFTGAINGKSHASRSDFTMSEDSNVLVQGVAGDRDSLGYFGFAYYSGNKDKLNVVAIKNKKAPVAPSLKTIAIQVSKGVRKSPDQADRLIHCLSISRYLERIADYATNIAEDVIYMIEGQNVRHQPEGYD